MIQGQIVTIILMLAGLHSRCVNELAERPLMSPLAGTKHRYVRLAIIIHCQILALFSSY